MELTPQDAGKDARFLLRRAQLHDGGTHGAEGEQRQGHSSPVRLLDEDHLVHGAPPLTAVLSGPTEPQPPVLSHPPDGGQVVGSAPVCRCHVGHQPREVGPEGGLQLSLLPTQLQAHATPFTSGNLPSASRRAAVVTRRRRVGILHVPTRRPVGEVEGDPILDVKVELHLPGLEVVRLDARSPPAGRHRPTCDRSWIA